MVGPLFIQRPAVDQFLEDEVPILVAVEGGPIDDAAEVLDVAVDVAQDDHVAGGRQLDDVAFAQRVAAHQNGGPVQAVGDLPDPQMGQLRIDIPVIGFDNVSVRHPSLLRPGPVLRRLARPAPNAFHQVRLADVHQKRFHREEHSRAVRVVDLTMSND